MPALFYFKILCKLIIRFDQELESVGDLKIVLNKVCPLKCSSYIFLRRKNIAKWAMQRKRKSEEHNLTFLAAKLKGKETGRGKHTPRVIYMNLDMSISVIRSNTAST